MMTYRVFQSLANEMFHDFEKALEQATSEQEEDFWMAKIEELEEQLEQFEVLRTMNEQELNQAATA